MRKNTRHSDGYARGSGDGSGYGYSRGCGDGYGWGTTASGDDSGCGDGSGQDYIAYNGRGDQKGQGAGRGDARGCDYGSVGDGTGLMAARAYAELQIIYKNKPPEESDE